MPLNTEIIRDGQILNVKWTETHPAAMVAAIAFETDESPFNYFSPNQGLDYPNEPQGIDYRNIVDLCNYGLIGSLPLENGQYTLKQDHYFVGPSGEVKFKAGDILKLYRSTKE